MESIRRFSNRVENYVRYRPGYPVALVDFIRREGGLEPGAIVADIASGTGKLSEPLLQAGLAVIGVEPNDEMRAAAEKLLGSFARFRCVAGTAEATGLPEASVDAITVGQAFHWFDPARSRDEFRRILRSGGSVFLAWNDRNNGASRFMTAYEDLLARHCPEYREVRDRQPGEAEFASFFAGGKWRTAQFVNVQVLDWSGVCGRLLSASYVPTQGPDHEQLFAGIRQAFTEEAAGGTVRFVYDTKVYFGKL